MTNFRQKPLLGKIINTSHLLADGLIGCWLLNEKTGIKASDSSIYYTDAGTLNGSTWKWLPNGLSFPGAATDYLSLPGDIRSKIASSNACSIVLWGRPNSIATDQRAVGLYTSNGNDRQIYVWMDSGGAGPSWAAGINTSAASGSIGEDATGTVDITMIQQVVVTWDGTSIIIYVNGIHQDSSSSFAGDINTASSEYRVGAWEINGSFDGDISSVYFYDRALSLNEIEYLYREPYAMFEDTPIWMFDQEVPVVGNEGAAAYHYLRQMGAYS